MNELWIGAGILALLFIFTFILSVKLDNYSFVDVTWSLSFAPIAVYYAAVGEGWMPRRVAVGMLVALWSLRLGIHLWARVAGHHPKEDARYAVLREGWKRNLQPAFLGFFLMQGLLTWLLTLPVYLICGNGSEGFGGLELAGFAVWLIALIGEGVADGQLRRFKASHPGRQDVCQVGLWRYSRHPNYFFQSLLWWGLFLMALPNPWGWIAIIAPLAMLFFLLRVTGVPLTEQLAVQSKGDAYRAYQATTSSFIPLPPKHL